MLQFLSGLNDSNDQARCQILMKIVEPTLNQAYTMIIENERQLTSNGRISSIIEGNNITALWSAKGPRQKPKRNFNLQCEYCKMKGHSKENFYQLVVYPLDFKGRKKKGIAVNATSFGGTQNKHINMTPSQSFTRGHFQGRNVVDKGYGFTPGEHRQSFSNADHCQGSTSQAHSQGMINNAIFGQGTLRYRRST